MKYISTIIISGLVFAIFSSAARSESIGAGSGWSNSLGNQTAYEKIGKNNRIDLMEKKEGGYYGGFNAYNSYFTSYAIGSQTIVTNSIVSNATITSSNCGGVNNQAQIDSNSSNTNKDKGDMECETEVGNNE